jgi:HEAT repeat protein
VGFQLALLCVSTMLREPALATAPIQGKPIEAWLKELESSRPELRRRAADAVFLLDPAGKESLPALVKLIQCPDADVAALAIRTVGDMGPGVAAPPVRQLEEASRDQRSRVRYAALMALGGLGVRGVPGLVVALSHDDPETRRCAARAVAMLSVWSGGHAPDSAAAAIPLLAAMARDKDPRTALSAIEALGAVGSIRPDTAVPPLVEGLKDPVLLEEAVRSLAHIGEPARSAVPALQRWLEAHGWEAPEREQVIRCLASLDAPPVAMLTQAVVQGTDDYSAVLLAELGPAARLAVPALLLALEDDRPAICTMSAIALAGIDPTSKHVVPVLVRSLNSTAPQTCVYMAVEALGRLGAFAEGSLDALIEALRGRDVQLRVAAVRALGDIGIAKPTVLSALVTALGDDEQGVAIAAADALGCLGPGARDAVHALVHVLERPPRKEKQSPNAPDLRVNAARALGLMVKEPSAAVDALIDSLNRALRDHDYFLASAAIDALARIGPEAACAAFPHLVNVARTDPVERRRAAVALAAYGAQGRAVALQLAKHSADHLARAAIMSALGLPSSEAQAFTLMGTKTLANEMARDLVIVPHIEYIGQFGLNARAAIPLLIKLRRHREKSIRQAAESALRRISPRPGTKKAQPQLGKPGNPGRCTVRGAGVLRGATHTWVLRPMSSDFVLRAAFGPTYAVSDYRIRVYQRKSSTRAVPG